MIAFVAHKRVFLYISGTFIGIAINLNVNFTITSSKKDKTIVHKITKKSYPVYLI